MGDVWLMVGCLGGIGILYTVILVVFARNTKTTKRPDLD